MPRSRYKFHEAEHPYFFTCTIVGWLPVFTRPEYVRIIFDSWKFLQDHGKIGRAVLSKLDIPTASISASKI